MITSNTLYQFILTSLDVKRSVSCCRFGDGEYLVANMTGDVSYRKHLGYIPDVKEQHEISENIILAARCCDMMGVTQNTGKQWGASRDYFLNLNTNAIITMADYHTEFLEKGYLDEILKLVDKLLYISGHNLTKGFRRKYPNIKTIKRINIPLQYKYYGNQIKKHYPDTFNETIKALQSEDLTGYLVLVGAGFVGKMYVIEAARSGAVAVDMGSVFDRLSGKITRGKLKGTESKEYKL